MRIFLLLTLLIFAACEKDESKPEPERRCYKFHYTVDLTSVPDMPAFPIHNETDSVKCGMTLQDAQQHCAAYTWSDSTDYGTHIRYSVGTCSFEPQ